jgi:hypothetical protein
MRRRRTGWIVVLLFAGAGAAGLIWAALHGRAPWAVQALTPVARTLESALAAPSAPPPLEDAAAPAVVPDASPPVHHQRTALSAAQLGAPLVHGTFVPACGAPDSMKVTVNVAVRQGRAIDVRAKADPANPVVEGCIEHAIRDLRWDVSPMTGRVTVHY